MSFLVDVMHKGGPFMWLLLLLLVVAPVPLVVGATVTALRKWVPSVTWWIVPGLAVIAGAVGRIQGQVMAGEAVAHASVETKSVLLHAGLGVAAYTEWAGWAFAFGCLLLGALVAGPCLAAGAGKGARLRLGLSAAVFLVALGGAALVVLVGWLGFVEHGEGGTWLWLLPLVVLSGGVAMALASLREGTTVEDLQRGAAGRAGLAAMVLGALVALWVASVLHAGINLHEGIAHAAPEMRSSLVAHGVFQARAWTLPGSVAALVVLVMGALVTLAGLRHLVRPRFVVSGLGTVALLLAVVLGAGFSNYHAFQLSERTVERRAMAVMDEVSGLPEPRALGATELEHLPLMGFVETASWDGGGWRIKGHDLHSVAPLSLPLDASSSSSLLLAAPGDLAASRLVGMDWAQEGGEPAPYELLVLVRQGQPHPELSSPWLVSAQLGTLALEWVPGAAWAPSPRHDEGGWDLDRALEHEYGTRNAWHELLFVEGVPGGLSLHGPGSSIEGVGDLGAAVARMADEAPDIVEGTVVLVPGKDWTLQDVVSHCLAVRAAMPERERDPWERVRTACAVSAEVPELLFEQREPAPAALDAPSGLGTTPLGDGSVVMGALDKSTIQRVIQRHLGAIRSCYERGLLRAGPALAGKVVIKFVVAQDGTVSSASVQSTTLSDLSTEACIIERFQRMRFPPPTGGGIVIVSYPFVFSAG